MILGSIPDMDQFNRDIRCMLLGDESNGQGIIAKQLEDMKRQAQQRMSALPKCISKADIVALKANNKPVDIIRFVFDALLIMMRKGVVPVKPTKRTVRKVEVTFIEDSFDAFR